MDHPIIQLGAGDFEEAVAHLSLVFGDPNFAELVPALYQPTDMHMSRNFAVRHQGRIAAIVGLFPIRWLVGGTELRLAGIGSVSVHPDHRGHGFMRLLMDEAMREIERAGYHAACLGGNRFRYAYWGFEKSGVEARFTVTPNSVLHAPSPKAARCGTVDEAGDEDIPALRRLYESQPIRCARNDEAFPRHLRTWRRRPEIIREESGRTTGYACVDSRDSSFVECCFEDGEALAAFVRARMGRDPQPMHLSMPMIQTPVFESLAALADDVSLIEASNWRIYDWAAVLGALMRAKHEGRRLAPGACVLRAKGTTGPAIRLAVEGSAVECREVDGPADVEAAPGELLRMLAGPLPLAMPAGGESVAAWRPLPLMIPMQDRI